eukprot:5910850-Amphidinium_carterae.1
MPWVTTCNKAAPQMRAEPPREGRIYEEQGEHQEQQSLILTPSFVSWRAFGALGRQHITAGTANYSAAYVKKKE